MQNTANHDIAEPWWGLRCNITPCFGTRLVQEGNRLHYLADRASFTGTFSDADLHHLDQAFPLLLKQMELMLTSGELNPRHQHCVTLYAKRVDLRCRQSRLTWLRVPRNLPDTTCSTSRRRVSVTRASRINEVIELQHQHDDFVLCSLWHGDDVRSVDARAWTAQQEANVALVGLASYDGDSGRMKGRRVIWGERAGYQTIIFMACFQCKRKPSAVCSH